jgi:metal-responsive CopG/Arc/MetJ family transcriptional regulator
MKAKEPAQMEKKKPVPVLVRLPKQIVNALDKAAKTNCRSRSQEVKVRLVRSLEAQA